MVKLIFLLFSDQISRGNLGGGGNCLGGAPAPCKRKLVLKIAKKTNHSYCSNHVTSSLLQLIIGGGGGACWPSPLQD